MVTQSIPLVADLRTQNRNIGTIYLATGLVTEGDTGGGIYFWNPASTNADDGFYYLQVTGVATGRWVRIYAGSNIYNTDGSLLDNRDVTLNGNYLKFIGSSANSTFNADGTVTLGSLSGADTRMVVAGSTGTLSTQSFVPGTTIRFVEKFTAIAGQTVFNTANTLYGDLFDVFLNGVKLNTDSFSFTANQITLLDGSYAGDIIDVVGFSSVTVYATLPSQAGNAGKFLSTDGTSLSWQLGSGGLSSVGISMPSAFTVANSPLTSNGTIAVTGAGTAAQYIRGDGALATFPSTSSGGSSVNYYLNGSINASVAGYKQLANTATIGGGTDFTLVGNGLIAQFLTDVGNPNRLEIPGGAWNFEMYFQVSSSGGNQKFYVELLKYDGTTFTSIASSSAVPEQITGGTSIDLYLTSLAVPTTSLLVTDRLAIRVYIVDNSGGRTVTLHTEDNTLCEIITTFAGGISALNGLTANTQYFATGTSGTDFNIASATDTHTFNLPTASATNRGALSSADWSTFSGKVGGSGATGQVAYWNGTNSQTGSAGLVYNDSTGVMTLSKNQNAGTEFAITNTTSGTASSSVLRLTNQADQLVIVKLSATNTGLGWVTGNSGWIYSGIGNLDLTTDNNTKRIRFGTLNGVGTPQMSLTGAGRLLLGTTTEGTDILDVNGSVKFGTAGTGTGMYWDNANNRLGIGIASPNQRLDILGNSNGGQIINIKNANAGTSAVAGFQAQSDTNSGSLFITSSGYTPYGVLTANTLGLYGSGSINVAVVVNSTGYFSIGTGNFTPTEKLRLTNAGRLLLGTTTESTYLLDVNGTSRVSGESTFNGNMNLTLNQNSITSFTVTNTNNNTNAYAIFNVVSDNTSGSAAFGKLSSTTTPNKIVSSKDFYIYNTVGGDIAILNDFASGTIKMAAGASSTAQMTLTAAGRLLLGTTSEGTFLLDVNGTARVSGDALIEKNQNAATNITISNTTSGASSSSSLTAATGSTNGITIGKYSSTTSTFKIINANDGYIYNGQLGDIAILNDNASGKIKFAAGASLTAQMTLTSAGRLLLGTTSESTYLLDVNSSVRFGSNFIWNNSDGRLDINGAAKINGVIITGNPTVPSGTAASLTEGYFAAGGYAFFQGYNYTTSAYIPVYIDGLVTYINPNSGGNVGINTSTNVPSAQLHISSTTKGFLPPRMTTTQKNAIGAPAAGLMVYDTTLNKLCVFTTAWETITSI